MKYLESHPDIAGGELVIKGTRITIAVILRSLSAGHTLEEIHEWYPHLPMSVLAGSIHEASDVIADTANA